MLASSLHFEANATIQQLKIEAERIKYLVRRHARRKQTVHVCRCTSALKLAIGAVNPNIDGFRGASIALVGVDTDIDEHMKTL